MPEKEALGTPLKTFYQPLSLPRMRLGRMLRASLTSPGSRISCSGGAAAAT